MAHVHPESPCTCHWCFETKPAKEFNAGHVMPKAFGAVDGNNPVLHQKECSACNKHFGDTIELALARDSKEGIDRFNHGVMRSREDARHLASDRLTFALKEGPLAGAPHEVDPTAPSGELRLRPARRIGVGLSPQGPWTWYEPERLPPKEELRGITYFSTAGSMSAEELGGILEGFGIKSEAVEALPDPRGADGKVCLTMTGTIDQDIMRAIAKIAFNYFVHEYPTLRLMPHFHEIRRYIRYGEEPSFRPVSISNRAVIGGVSPSMQLIAHAVSVMWNRRRCRVVALVSLFGWLRYEVTLSTVPFIIEPTCIDSGLAFNTYAKQAVPLTRNLRLAARTMPLLTKEEFKTWARPKSNKSS
jgi:hypothetical protein